MDRSFAEATKVTKHSEHSNVKFGFKVEKTTETCRVEDTFDDGNVQTW